MISNLSESSKLFPGLRGLSAVEIKKDIKEIECRFSSDTDSESSVLSEDILPSTYPVKPRKSLKLPTVDVTQREFDDLDTDFKSIQESLAFMEAMKESHRDLFDGEHEREILERQHEAHELSIASLIKRHARERKEYQNYVQMLQGYLARALHLHGMYSVRSIMLANILTNLRRKREAIAMIEAETDALKKAFPDIFPPSRSTGESDGQDVTKSTFMITKTASRSLSNLTRDGFTSVLNIHVKSTQQRLIMYAGQWVRTPIGEGAVIGIYPAEEKVVIKLSFGFMYSNISVIAGWLKVADAGSANAPADMTDLLAMRRNWARFEGGILDVPTECVRCITESLNLFESEGLAAQHPELTAASVDPTSQSDSDDDGDLHDSDDDEGAENSLPDDAGDRGLQTENLTSGSSVADNVLIKMLAGAEDDLFPVSVAVPNSKRSRSVSFGDHASVSEETLVRHPQHCQTAGSVKSTRFKGAEQFTGKSLRDAEHAAVILALSPKILPLVFAPTAALPRVVEHYLSANGIDRGATELWSRVGSLPTAASNSNGSASSDGPRYPAGSALARVIAAFPAQPEDIDDDSESHDVHKERVVSMSSTSFAWGSDRDIEHMHRTLQRLRQEKSSLEQTRNEYIRQVTRTREKCLRMSQRTATLRVAMFTRRVKERNYLSSLSSPSPLTLLDGSSVIDGGVGIGEVDLSGPSDQLELPVAVTSSQAASAVTSKVKRKNPPLGTTETPSEVAVQSEVSISRRRVVSSHRTDGVSPAELDRACSVRVKAEPPEAKLDGSRVAVDTTTATRFKPRRTGGGNGADLSGADVAAIEAALDDDMGAPNRKRQLEVSTVQPTRRQRPSLPSNGTEDMAGDASVLRSTDDVNRSRNRSTNARASSSDVGDNRTMASSSKASTGKSSSHISDSGDSADIDVILTNIIASGAESNESAELQVDAATLKKKQKRHR